MLSCHLSAEVQLWVKRFGLQVVIDPAGLRRTLSCLSRLSWFFNSHRASRTLSGSAVLQSGIRTGCRCWRSLEEAGVMVRVYVFNREGRLVGPVDSPAVELSDEEWKERLTHEQYRILRKKGTEQAFCGNLLDNKQQGV